MIRQDSGSALFANQVSFAQSNHPQRLSAQQVNLINITEWIDAYLVQLDTDAVLKVFLILRPALLEHGKIKSENQSVECV